MSSVFAGDLGPGGLRSRFAEAAVTDMTTGTHNSKAAALCIAGMDMGARFLYIDNGFDAVLDFWLVHPEQDASVVANRRFWLSIGKTRVMNFDFLPSLGMFFDPGTKLYVAYRGAAPTTESLRISWWA
jgi:hypothetical protein